MRSFIFGSLVCGLAVSTVAIAAGYYPQSGGPGSINWPPPGGISAMQQPLPAYSAPANTGFRPQPQYRYQPPRKYKNELISPPSADWPNAGYHEPLGQRTVDRVPPQRVEMGAPVEVIPPPSIPMEEVNAPLSDKPERNWRPMKELEQLESLEETATPPATAKKSEPVMRDIAPPAMPPVSSTPPAAEAATAFTSGMSIRSPVEKTSPPPTPGEEK